VETLVELGEVVEVTGKFVEVVIGVEVVVGWSVEVVGEGVELLVVELVLATVVVVALLVVEVTVVEETTSVGDMVVLDSTR